MHDAANDAGRGVDFRTQYHRDFARQHIADDPPADAGDDAHTDGHQRPAMGNKGFVDADTDKHRQTNGVQHRQYPFG